MFVLKGVILTLIIMIAILLAIAIGYKTKINIGLFAIVFAYLIGSFGLDLTASQVVNFWPIKIFFIIFAVTLFYNVAMVNGALEKCGIYGHKGTKPCLA